MMALQGYFLPDVFFITAPGGIPGRWSVLIEVDRLDLEWDTAVCSALGPTVAGKGTSAISEGVE